MLFRTEHSTVLFTPSTSFCNLLAGDEVGGPLVRSPEDDEAPAGGALWHDRDRERSRGCMPFGVGQFNFCRIEFRIVLRPPRVGFVVEHEPPSGADFLQPYTVGPGEAGN